MVGIGLGELKKGENELSKKKILLAVQITIELAVFLGIRGETLCRSTQERDIRPFKPCLLRHKSYL